MKKRALALVASAISLSAALFAYNPPFGGEELLRLTEPAMISGAASAVGGPTGTIIPASITYNPALIATEQRIDLDLSSTLFFNTDKVGEDDAAAGYGFQLGLMIPTKWCVFAGTTNGMFADFNGMNLGNSWITHAGAAKEITDRFSMGADLYFGLYMGSGTDVTVGLDLGLLYLFDDISFLKSPKLGVSLLNLGKPVTNYEVYGISDDYDNDPKGKNKDGENYPGFITPRVGFGADLFEVKKLVGGFSADLAIPTFQNAIFDFGFGLTYDKIACLNIGWQANIREIAEGGVKGVNVPSIGLSFKFVINSKKLTEKNADWEKSEITPSVAWQDLYGGIHAISFGARLDLGMMDTTAPEIILWDEE